MKRVNSAAAQRRALTNTHELITDVVTTLVPNKPLQVDTRDELQKIRDEADVQRRQDLHEMLINDSRMQVRVKETGLTADQLLELAGEYKGEGYMDALMAITGQMQRSDASFTEARTAWKMITGHSKES
jgi:hypothetical protein